MSDVNILEVLDRLHSAHYGASDPRIFADASLAIKAMQAQLAERDAALRAADNVVISVAKDAVHIGMSSETRDAIVAYGKARGRDA